MRTLTFVISLAALLITSNVQAATYYVAAKGSGSTCSQASRCALQAALDKAQAGDEIAVADGIYTDSYEINTASGTASKKIRVYAENRHKAVLQGSGAKSESNYGFSVRKSHWIIENFRFRDHYSAVWGDTAAADYVEVRDNLIYNFYYDGIRLRGDYWNIHHNVIGLSEQFKDNGRGVSVRGGSGSHNIIRENVVYAINDDGYQAGEKFGGCFILFEGSKSNTIQGNICMANAKNDMTVATTETPKDESSHNMVRDNIWAYSEGGGFSPRDKKSNDNSFINNLCYATHSCVGGKGNTPGRNKIIHNTAIVTALSGSQAFGAGRDSGVVEQARTFQSNLIYSNVSQPKGHGNVLHVLYNYEETFKNGIHSHNLFWAPWPSNTWVHSRESSYRFTSTDIHDPNRRPVFNDEANGDFTLAAGSAGKGAAHDGTDIGIVWNQYLTLPKFQKVFFLPNREVNTSGKTSARITGLSPDHEYQVYVYVPSSYYNGTETYKVQGNEVKRDLVTLFKTSRWFYGKWNSGNNRYVALGNHPVSNDGSLNISWSHSNAAEKIFIRQLPTVEQAHAWVRPDPTALEPKPLSPPVARAPIVKP